MHLIPTQDEVINLLTTTGALRKGHFEYSNGLHANEYLQVALAMRYFPHAKTLSVGLSRQLRANPEIRAMIPLLAPDHLFRSLFTIMPKRPTQLRQRRNRIVFFWFRVLVTAFWWDVLVRNLGGRQWAARTALKRYLNHARRFRLLAIDLGGVMIKLGQFFASRVDILPKEIIDELAGLQDEVPPESFDDIRTVLESELNRPLGDIFQSIEPMPVAAASLGQAHRVVLKSGERAIVKVQRPGIDVLVAVDLEAVRTAVRWLKRWGPIRRRADVDALYDEFCRTLNMELDYLAEGRNIERFRTDFKDWETIASAAFTGN